MTYKEAKAAFAAKVDELGGLKQMAFVIGKTEATVSLIKNGKRRPSFRLATLLHEKWKIPIEAWFADKKRRKQSA